MYNPCHICNYWTPEKGCKHYQPIDRTLLYPGTVQQAMEAFNTSIQEIYPFMAITEKDADIVKDIFPGKSFAQIEEVAHDIANDLETERHQ